MKKEWEQEEIDSIIYEYNVLRWGQKKVARAHHSDDRTIKKILQQNNIHIRNIAEANCSGYNINHAFFDRIDSNVAYILGLLASDGCVAKNENCIYIELQICDIDLLKKVNDLLQNERPVKEYTTGRGYKNAKLYFYSSRIKKKLADYSIVPNKTYSNVNFLEKIPRLYYRDFIRGFFDGDGWISKTQKMTSCSWGLVNMAYPTIIAIQRFFQEEGIDLTLTRHNSPNGYKYAIHGYGKEKLTKIYKILYTDRDLYLTRKYEKICSLI